MKNKGYVFLSMIFWGFWAFLPKLAIRYLDPGSILVFEVLAGLTIAAVIIALKRSKISFRLAGVLPAFLAGILGYGGMFVYILTVAEQASTISVIATLTGIYPVITLILGLLFLKERLSRINYIGIFLALISVALLTS